MQVGNYTTDQDYWGRPEDYTLDRPYYIAGDDVGATDLAATMCSALAATALVWKSSDTAYYTTLMTAAESLYAYATKVFGNYGDMVSAVACLCLQLCEALGCNCRVNKIAAADSKLLLNSVLTCVA